MEMRTVPYSWLAELDRRYGSPRGRLLRRANSSGSPPTPSGTWQPGMRPLPPMQHTARELLCPGRTFRLLLGQPPRLSCPWIVVAHKVLTCQFRAVEIPGERVRSIPWTVWENHLLANRVRWANSTGRPSQLALKRHATARWHATRSVTNR